MDQFDGHPGTAKLAQVLDRRTSQKTESPLTLDFGEIQANGSLKTNTFPVPIPKVADSYYSKPQREEYFVDSGYYKYHEAYHLLKFPNEKQMLERAYEEYQELKKNNLWGSHRYE